MASYVDETGQTINIELSQDMMNACNASYLELINYYIAYPQKFFKDMYRRFFN